MLNMDSALRSSTANGTVWISRSDFEPIPQLTVSDADLLLVFLSPEGVFYFNRTEDPWYRATVPTSPATFLDMEPVLYKPDEAASPLGCVQRYQYCDSSKHCGSLASHADALLSASTIFHSSPGDYWSDVDPSYRQDATNSRFLAFRSILRSSLDLYALISALGPSCLLSSQHLGQGFMGPLPNNQWQLDVSHWFAMGMASLQAVFVNNARGPNDEALLPYVDKSSDEYHRTLCNNQVSRTFIILSTRSPILPRYLKNFTH